MIGKKKERSAEAQKSEALLCRACSGDKTSFRALVERYQTPLYSFILRMVRQPAVAEELVQETFVRAYRAAARYRPESSVSTWLFFIANRLAANEAARAYHSEEQLLEIPERPSSMPDALEISEKRQLLRIVENALDKLPPRQRAAIILSRLEGMSYREVSEILDISEGAVDGLLQRAQGKLAEVLRPFL